MSVRFKRYNFKMYTTTAFAKTSLEDPNFHKIEIQRNELGDNDVELDVKFCGICHYDVHIANSELKVVPTNYPCVPGHELAGIVTKVGKNVQKVKAGDKVGVGTIVESCHNCEACKNGDENYCHKGHIWTYNHMITYGSVKTNTGYTLGGYTTSYTVPQDFTLKIPDDYPLEAAGPIFCAGISMYSPLKHWGAFKGGMNVGIIGIGGLGQMGVRLAKAMGNKVTAISTSPHKVDIAKEIGATNFVLSTDEASMKEAANSLDVILNTVSVNHECGMYIPLLRTNGTLVQLGASLEPHSISQIPLMFGRRSLAGSIVGGIKDTQECMDFCYKNNIVPVHKVVTYDELPKIFELLSGKNDSCKRYVLDIVKSNNM